MWDLKIAAYFLGAVILAHGQGPCSAEPTHAATNLAFCFRIVIGRSLLEPIKSPSF